MTHVPLHHLIHPTIHFHCRVLSNHRNKGTWHPGVISFVHDDDDKNGKIYNVEYDDKGRRQQLRRLSDTIQTQFLVSMS